MQATGLENIVHQGGNLITFFVPGKPQGKGRARAFNTKSGHIGHYTPGKTRTYEGLIRTQAMQEMGLKKPTRKPVQLTLGINYAIPASWPKWKIQAARDGHIAPTGKPDADNVVKAVKDALNGVVWRDDCQVVLMSVNKRYCTDPGLLIQVNVMHGMAEMQIKTKTELQQSGKLRIYG